MSRILPAFLPSVALLVLLVGLSGGASAQTTYTFTDLGALNISSPWTRAMGINNAGQVVGVTRTAAGLTTLYRITPTTDALGNPIWNQDANSDGINDLIQPLPLPGSYTASFANPGAGINASGQTTGTLRSGPRGNLTPQSAAVWSATGVPTVLTVSTITGNANDVNDGGDVVGDFWDYKKNKPVLPYLWKFSSGSYTAVALSSSSGSAYAVNNLRQVVGTVNGATFLYLPTVAYGLPAGANTISGISLSYPGRMVNNGGIICGYNAANHLCLWVPAGGGMAYGLANGINDLGNAGWAFVYPHSVNNPLSGQPLRVVGSFQDVANNQFAFVWDSASGNVINLNTAALNLPAGWMLNSANAINDSGQIVGEGTYNGVRRGFVLTPQ